MKIHIVSIGTEILIGHTVNTNLAFLGDGLERVGYEVANEVCVPDFAASIAAAVRHELETADLVLTIGGLGPTRDDLTRPVIAELLAMPLELRPEVLAHIESYLARRAIKLNCTVLECQAMVPRGAAPLLNCNGTAPGLWCPVGGKTLVMLPGPPQELQPMFENDVLPRILKLAPPSVSRRSLRVCGIPESIVEERCEQALAGLADLDLAFCARPMLVDVRLSGQPAQTALLDEAVDRLRREFGTAVLEAAAPSVVASIGSLLRARGWRMATAESCTGGGIAAHITDEPGASAFFLGAVVSYANEWKEELLGVRPETLARHGAVSAEVAEEMVRGLLARTGAEAGLAVTGIAGPDGGTADKPVGLVYIGVAAGPKRQVLRQVFPGNRATVRERTVVSALNALREILLQTEKGDSHGRC